MYPTGHLKNTKTGRYHPISFRCAPRPSDNEVTDDTVRYKSVGHHSEGLNTLEESKAFVASNPDMKEMDLVWEWDGEGVPAMIWEFPPPAKLLPQSPS